jgi:hypothetical protein
VTHSDIAKYLRNGFPKASGSESDSGWEYDYIGPAGTIAVPVIGTIWDTDRGSLPVASFEREPLELSGPTNVAQEYVTLRLSTRRPILGGGGTTIGSVLEEGPFYDGDWVRNQVPLITHPAFQPGGSHDLFEVVGLTKGIQELTGWEMEEDPQLKANRQDRRLDSSGNPTGATLSIDSRNPNARDYIKLIQTGHDTRTIWTPTWSRRRRYRGSQPPDGEDLGQLLTAGTKPPGMPGTWPTNFRWIKTQDKVSRVGSRGKWERHEMWEGAKYAYFDVDQLDQAAIDNIP